MTFEEFLKVVKIRGVSFELNEKQKTTLANLEAKWTIQDKFFMYDDPGIGASTLLTLYAVWLAIDEPGTTVGYMVALNEIDSFDTPRFVLEEVEDEFPYIHHDDVYTFTNGSTLRILAGRQWDTKFEYFILDGSKRMRPSDWVVLARDSSYMIAHTSFKT